MHIVSLSYFQHVRVMERIRTRMVAALPGGGAAGSSISSIRIEALGVGQLFHVLSRCAPRCPGSVLASVQRTTARRHPHRARCASSSEPVLHVCCKGQLRFGRGRRHGLPRASLGETLGGRRPPCRQELRAKRSRRNDSLSSDTAALWARESSASPVKGWVSQSNGAGSVLGRGRWSPYSRSLGAVRRRGLSSA